MPTAGPRPRAALREPGLAYSGSVAYGGPWRGREATVAAGAGELEAGAGPLGRVRRPDGGRKKAAETDPGLVPALSALAGPDERGDPASPLRWTAKPTRTLAAELTARGHRVGADTVGDLLRAEGFSLQGNVKTIEGRWHPDRDAQFRYINEQARAHQGTADPVISVDTKKRSSSGISGTGAGSGGRRAGPLLPAPMTSPGTAGAGPSPTGSMT